MNFKRGFLNGTRLSVPNESTSSLPKEITDSESPSYYQAERCLNSYPFRRRLFGSELQRQVRFTAASGENACFRPHLPTATRVTPSRRSPNRMHDLPFRQTKTPRYPALSTPAKAIATQLGATVANVNVGQGRIRHSRHRG